MPTPFQAFWLPLFDCKDTFNQFNSKILGLIRYRSEELWYETMYYSNTLL